MNNRLDIKKEKHMQRMQELNALIEVYMKHGCLDEVFIYMDLMQKSSWLKRWTCPITIKHIMNKNHFLWTLMHTLFPVAAFINYIIATIITDNEDFSAAIPSVVVWLLAFVIEKWFDYIEYEVELLMHQHYW